MFAVGGEPLYPGLVVFKANRGVQPGLIAPCRVYRPRPTGKPHPKTLIY